VENISEDYKRNKEITVYYYEMINNSENKIQTIWNIIKKETTKIQKTDNISQLRIQDKQINIPTEIGDAINQYFITAVCKIQIDNSKRKEAVKLLHESKNNYILEMKSIPTTEDDTKHVTESMRLENSAGYEGISCTILKYCIHAIAKPHSRICHASLNQSIYPVRLIFAIVMLIYKQGEKIM
jgi:hypothetical protein